MTKNVSAAPFKKKREKSIRAMLRSHLGRVASRQQVIDLALSMPVDDGPDGCGQISMGLDGNEFAGFDQRRDGCPQDKSKPGVKRWLIENIND
jgi:hypothetical protein